jgi:hypothetical protein
MLRFDRPPRLLCLDVATNTGVCEGIVGEAPSFETVNFTKETVEHEEVFGKATAWAAMRIKLWKPDVVYIEAPVAQTMFGNTNADSGLRLIGLWAVIAGIARARGIPCKRANIAAIRQLTFGNSRLKSEIAKKQGKHLCEQLGWKAKTYDESDAAMVFLWAAYQVYPQGATRIEPIFLAGESDGIRGEGRP